MPLLCGWQSFGQCDTEAFAPFWRPKAFPMLKYILLSTSAGGSTPAPWNITTRSTHHACSPALLESSTEEQSQIVGCASTIGTLWPRSSVWVWQAASVNCSERGFKGDREDSREQVAFGTSRNIDPGHGKMKAVSFKGQIIFSILKNELEIN